MGSKSPTVRKVYQDLCRIDELYSMAIESAKDTLGFFEGDHFSEAVIKGTLTNFKTSVKMRVREIRTKSNEALYAATTELAMLVSQSQVLDD